MKKIILNVEMNELFCKNSMEEFYEYNKPRGMWIW